MLQRYLTVTAIPELRPDPVQLDKSSHELEVMIPIDTYWKIEELIKEIRYARIHGLSTYKPWVKFAKLIFPCIVSEKERYWFRKHIHF